MWLRRLSGAYRSTRPDVCQALCLGPLLQRPSSLVGSLGRQAISILLFVIHDDIVDRCVILLRPRPCLPPIAVLHSDVRPSGGETPVPQRKLMWICHKLSAILREPCWAGDEAAGVRGCTTRVVNWPRRSFSWRIAHVQMGSASERCRRTGLLVKCLTFSCPEPGPDQCLQQQRLGAVQEKVIAGQHAMMKALHVCSRRRPARRSSP